MTLTLGGIGLFADFIGVVLVVCGIFLGKAAQTIKHTSTLSGLGVDHALEVLLTRNDLIFGTTYLVFGFGTQFLDATLDGAQVVSFGWMFCVVLPAIMFVFSRRRLAAREYVVAFKNEPEAKRTEIEVEMKQWLNTGTTGR